MTAAPHGPPGALLPRARPAPARTPARTPAGGTRPAPQATWAALALVVAANILAVTGSRVPFLEPVLGCWLILAHPVYLLGTSSVWRGTRAAERLGGSLCAVLLALMAGGLVLNTFLPILGVARPLGRIPVLVLADAMIAALCLLRRRYPPDFRWTAGPRPPAPSAPSAPPAPPAPPARPPHPGRRRPGG